MGASGPMIQIIAVLSRSPPKPDRNLQLLTIYLLSFLSPSFSLPLSLDVSFVFVLSSDLPSVFPA